jgi:membrane protease YdiL (CAAX protease family)
MDQTPLPHLAAGGSLEAVAPTRAGLARRAIELVLLYVGLPLAIAYLVSVQHVSVLLLLQPVLLAILAFLLIDPTFRVKRELGRLPPARLLLHVLGLFVVVAAALAAFMAYFQPAQFLGLPRRAPIFWAIIMVFYPLLSAFPQELIYRTLFFHRFGVLFGNRRVLAAAINGVLFGFAHIMFGSWISVVLSGLFGFVVAWRYARSRSFWGAWFEHALYGDLVFTVGLGRYFFTGNGFTHH